MSEFHSRIVIPPGPGADEPPPAVHCAGCKAEIASDNATALIEVAREFVRPGILAEYPTGRVWCSPACRDQHYTPVDQWLEQQRQQKQP